MVSESTAAADFSETEERLLRPVSVPPRLGGLSARREWQRRLVRRIRVTDALVIVTAVALAQAVRFGDLHVSARSASIAYLNYTLISVAVAVLWIIALGAYGARSVAVIGSGPEEYRWIVSATLHLFGLIAIYALMFRVELARGYLAIAFPLGLLGLLLTRWSTRRRVVRRQLKGEHRTSVLVVGQRRAVLQLAHTFAQNPASGHYVVGVCIPGNADTHDESVVVDGRWIPAFGNEHSVVHALGCCGADTVAVTATEELGTSGLRKLVWDLEPYDVDLVVSPGVLDVAGPRLVMRPFAGLPLVHVEKPAYRGAQRLGKTAFDVMFSLVALVVVAPLLLCTAIAIKLTSRGPVLYRSERIGRDGRAFSMLKFRSMEVGADRLVDGLTAHDVGAGALFKIREDPRVTRVGRFIRRFSIDELPQFVNVLQRKMSVVGPRPPLRREVEGYEGEVHRRLLVNPGMTGLWQISGRSDLSWEESVRLDLSYIENWSMVGDLLIIAKTVRAVLAGDGAY